MRIKNKLELSLALFIPLCFFLINKSLYEILRLVKINLFKVIPTFIINLGDVDF